MIQLKNSTIRAFTLPEVMIATLIFSAISLGLLMGFTSLERCFAATTDFATNHSDEMRISDYLALDLRRALSVQATQNDTTIFIPCYYDAAGAPQTPTLDGNGGVVYPGSREPRFKCVITSPAAQFTGNSKTGRPLFLRSFQQSPSRKM